MSGSNGNELQLAWPMDHLGWTIQAQTNAIESGLSTNWVDLPDTNLTNLFAVPISATNGGVFFRLAAP